MTNPAQTMPYFDATDAEWIAWYEKLRKYGYKQAKANELFIQVFTARGGDKANTIRLREFAKKNKFSIEGGWGGAIADGLYDTSKGIGGGFKGFSSIVMLMVLLGMAVIGYVVYNIIKK